MPWLVSASKFSTAQSSINFVYREGFRNKIAEPLTGFLVIRVIGILECFENLCKSLRPTTVFGWTTSFTRHTNLLKRFLSKQNFFKKKFVLPAVPKSYSYNNLASTVQINSPSLVRFSSATLVPTLDLGSVTLCL